MGFLKFKRFKIAVCLGLIFTIFLSLAKFDASCDNLRENCLRLHIRANSDSEFDQSVKLKVRDAVLNASTCVFDGTDSIDDAIYITSRNLAMIEKIANEVLSENGAKYTANSSVGKAYFETRDYDSFTLPAGEYESLIIELGEGKGHNWWCVIYPEVCIPSAVSGGLKDSCSKQAAYVAENKNQYICRFKIVEIYEDIKNLINL